MRTIDEGDYEGFSDIYACGNGSYALCGSLGLHVANDANADIWVVSLSAQGEVIWSRRFGEQNVFDAAYSIIEADNGDFVVGGRSSNQFTALRISSDGELIWMRSYGSLTCNALIELKNGNFLLAGRTSQGTRARLVCIEGNGDQIWESSYGFVRGGESYLNEFWGIRETDGDVVVAGQGWDENSQRTSFWALKASLENEGEQIWSEYYPIDIYGSCRSLASSGDGGFALAGIVGGRQVDSSIDFGLLRIDAQGEELWHQRYHFREDNFVEYCNGLTRVSDGGFVLVGQQPSGDRYRPAAMRVRPDGTVRWQQLIEFREEDGFGQGAQARHGFSSVIEDHHNSILAVGWVYVERGGEQKNGLIVKSEPEPPGIGFINYFPQDTVFSVLRQDTVNFGVVVHNFDERQLEFNWSQDGERIETDSTGVQLDFPEFGQTEVQCVVDAEDLRISIRWHVTVTDLCISAFSPDTLNLSVPRGDSLLFSIDTVRYLGEIEPGFLWTVTNLNNGQTAELGENSSVTVPFLRSGSYTVEGRAYRFESSDAVVWNVSVGGIIQAYIPEVLTFDVEPDSVVHFQIVPSEPENESLTIQWLVDGELAAEDTTAFEWNFSGADLNPPYQSIVSAIVADSVEADTVTWSVTVRDLAVPQNDPSADPPRSAAILSVSPNPFNSTLTIRFSESPHAIAGGVGGVSLRIYDLSGRLVADLLGSTGVSAGHGKHPAAEGGATGHSAIWNASSVPAGVYLVRLQSGSDVSTQKVVLMR